MLARARARSSGRRVTTEIDTLPETDDEVEPETGPLRCCIVTRSRLPKERMFRFVVAPDRTVVPDLSAKLPGRGIWLSASGDVIVSGGVPGDMDRREKDRRLVRAFARAARGPVSVPPNLSDMLEAALLRRIGETLGLARRAGQAIAGFEKAREWVRGGRARVVLQASDGSAAERARFMSGCDPSVAVVDPLPAVMLGRIFARDHAVHVAVSPGRLAETLVIDAERLAGLKKVSGRMDGRATALMDEEAGANG